MNTGAQHLQRPKRGGCPRSLSRLGPALPELKECRNPTAGTRKKPAWTSSGGTRASSNAAAGPPLFRHLTPAPPPWDPSHCFLRVSGRSHPNAARSASCRAPECRFYAARSQCPAPDRRFRSLLQQHGIKHPLFDWVELCGRAERPRGLGEVLRVPGDGHPDPFARHCASEWFPFAPAPVLLWQAGPHAPACLRGQGTPRFCGAADFSSGSRPCGVSVCNMLRLSSMEWNRGGSGAGRFWALTAGAVGF